MIKTTQLLKELSLQQLEEDLLFQDVNNITSGDGVEDLDDGEDYFNYFQNQVIIFQGRSSRLEPMKEIKTIFNSSKSLAIDGRNILSDRRTTLMLKNIPLQYSVKDLIQEIENEFKGKYDYLHMPYDQFRHGNLGYAFINLTMPQFVQEFYNCFNQRKWKHEQSKSCTLRYAKMQQI